MIIKFFDKLHYKLSLSEEHINDIIKSNSKYGADIKRDDYSYDVKFTDKGFKMKFVPTKNYGGIYSLSPIFLGKIEEDCGYSDLTVRMIPSPMMVVAFIIFSFLFFIGCNLVLTGTLNPRFKGVGFVIIFFCVFIQLTNMFFNNMKSIVDGLFSKYQIKDN